MQWDPRNNRHRHLHRPQNPSRPFRWSYKTHLALPSNRNHRGGTFSRRQQVASCGAFPWPPFEWLSPATHRNPPNLETLAIRLDSFHEPHVHRSSISQRWLPPSLGWKALVRTLPMASPEQSASCQRQRNTRGGENESLERLQFSQAGSNIVNGERYQPNRRIATYF